MNKKERCRAELEQKQARLNLYYKQEEKMLTGGVQSYGLGSRNLTKYNTDLAQIRDAISKLEGEIEELEGLISGNKSRKCVGIIPRF
jgi:exonuclease VII small subunit